MAANVWTSERLIYRPAEASDDAFLAWLSQDAESFTQAAPFLPTPNGDATGTSSREWMNKCFLGVLICEPVPNAPKNAAEAAEAAAAPPVLDADGKEKPKPKPKPIGFITMMNDDPKQMHHRRANIGLTVGPGFQGKGYGTEAINWCLHWGFMFAGLHRISIGAFSFNERALALYRRLGFVQEGVSREALWFNGKFHDIVELGMLDREWHELHSKKKEITQR